MCFKFVYVGISMLIQRCGNTVDNTVNGRTRHDELDAVKVHCQSFVKHCTFLLYDPAN